MIEVKAGELVSAYNALDSLRAQPLPAGQAYRIARLGRELEKEVGLYQNARTEVITKYCAKDDEGNPITDENGNISIKQGSDNFTLAANELENLANEIIQINVEPLELKELNDVKFTPEQMNNLIMFIRE